MPAARVPTTSMGWAFATDGPARAQTASAARHGLILFMSVSLARKHPGAPDRMIRVQYNHSSHGHSRPLAILLSKLNMANSTVGAGSPPAATNVFSRFIGIITSPKATFQGVVANPKILGMLLLTTLIIAVCAALPMTTEAGKQAALDQQVSQMESFGFKVNDEQYEGMRKGMAFAPYTTAISVAVASPIIIAILAGILFAIFNAAMGGEASYKQVYSVVTHAGVISALGQLFVGPFNYFRGSMANPTTLAALLPMFDDTSFMGKLAGMIDLFIIWWVIVLAMGLAVLYRRRTQPIAMTLFGIYALIIVCVAAFTSR
jgi:hypothetical protein